MLWHIEKTTQTPGWSFACLVNNAAYALAFGFYRQQEMRDNARMHNRPEPTDQDYSDAAAVDERIRQAIEKIITLDGIEIESCGLWVWVSGDTKPTETHSKPQDTDGRRKKRDGTLQASQRAAFVYSTWTKSGNHTEVGSRHEFSIRPSRRVRDLATV